MVSVLSYLGEASVTQCAGVRPLPSVGVHVAPQVPRGGEAFITNLAGVRLPSRVDPLVIVQVAGRREPKQQHCCRQSRVAKYFKSPLNTETTT